MPIEHLRHQRIEGAPASGDGVQDVGTVGFALDGTFDGLNLAAEPADPIEHFLFVANNVGQLLPRSV